MAPPREHIIFGEPGQPSTRTPSCVTPSPSASIHNPPLPTLVQSTTFLLAWRALVAYRTFLADIHQCADNAASAVLSMRSTSEICTRLLAGAYLVRALRSVLHSLSGDWASGISSGTLLAQWVEELINGALNAYIIANPCALVAGGLGVGMLWTPK